MENSKGRGIFIGIVSVVDTIKLVIDEYVKNLVTNAHFVEDVVCKHKDYSVDELNKLLKEDNIVKISGGRYTKYKWNN